MHGEMGESFYTKSVSNLVKSIQDNTSLRDSIFEQAQIYFETSDEQSKAYLSLQKKIRIIEKSLLEGQPANKSELIKDLNIAKKTLSKNFADQETARIHRLQKVLLVCHKLLLLSEAENYQKTQTNSAKLLGTLQLLSPGEGTKLALQNMKFKPAYKAVIAIRLLDKLRGDDKFNNKYISEYDKLSRRYSQKENELTTFQQEVVIPIFVAALLQDVGTLHPKSQKILKGENGKLDEFRLLEKQDRLTLLKINHEQTLNYISYGLGLEQYIGNSRNERDHFDETQIKRLHFTRSLLIGARKPELGLGNLIKAPQIYTSVIFSSKQNHSYFDLPKGMLLVMKAAQANSLSKLVADSLLSILGHFPQGYGITYIPKDDDDNDAARYEYAIVTGLNPRDPYVPICRVVTRNLTFIDSGALVSIDTKSNLYFPAPKKKLEKVNPERLKEILSKLVSNFDERKELEMIPSYWNPYSFFCYVKLQNIWKKAQ
jgi:hypothetical protein